MALVHIPARQGQVYVNPDHVVEVRRHESSDTLAISLVNGTTLTVDTVLVPAEVVLKVLGY